MYTSTQPCTSYNVPISFFNSLPYYIALKNIKQGEKSIATKSLLILHSKLSVLICKVEFDSCNLLPIDLFASHCCFLRLFPGTGSNCKIELHSPSFSLAGRNLQIEMGTRHSLLQENIKTLNTRKEKKD